MANFLLPLTHYVNLNIRHRAFCFQNLLKKYTGFVNHYIDPFCMSEIHCPTREYIKK